MLDPASASLCTHTSAYGFLTLGLVVLLFGYIAYVDAKTFRIPNALLLLLLPLYALYVVVTGRWTDVLSEIAFAALIFSICLFFYSKNALGGGDVKFLPLTCLFVGLRDAMPFCLFLLILILMHYGAVRVGWMRFRSLNGRRVMPYGPSISGAFLATLALGCYFAHPANMHALRVTHSTQLQRYADQVLLASVQVDFGSNAAVAFRMCGLALPL
jgi:prepilin peptidase CpaA